jgi:hypothetical protein
VCGCRINYTLPMEKLTKHIIKQLKYHTVNNERKIKQRRVHTGQHSPHSRGPIAQMYDIVSFMLEILPQKHFISFGHVVYMHVLHRIV